MIQEEGDEEKEESKPAPKKPQSKEKEDAAITAPKMEAPAPVTKRDAKKDVKPEPKEEKKKETRPTKAVAGAPASRPKPSSVKKNLNDSSFRFVELTNVEPSAMWDNGDLGLEDEDEDAKVTQFADFKAPTPENPRKRKEPSTSSEASAINEAIPPPAKNARVEEPKPRVQAPAQKPASKAAAADILDVSSLSQISISQSQAGKKVKLSDASSRQKVAVLNTTKENIVYPRHPLFSPFSLPTPLFLAPLQIPVGAGKAKTQTKILSSIMAGFVIPKLKSN